MKALSLTPWWAWLVARGLKLVENRKWRTHFRGEFLIHASLGAKKHRVEVVEFLHRVQPVPNVCYSDGRHPSSVFFGSKNDSPLARDIHEHWCAHPEQWLPGEEVPRGGIVGSARLVDCVTTHRSPWFFGPYGWVLEDVRPFPFIECKGALSFWQVPADVRLAVEMAMLAPKAP